MITFLCFLAAHLLDVNVPLLLYVGPLITDYGLYEFLSKERGGSN